MLSNRIRTTAVTLIAASSFAVASAPLASVASAAPNNHTYQKTVGKRPWHNTCSNAQISFENALTLAETDAKEGQMKYAEQDLDLASKIYENAKASGCSIGIVKLPSKRTIGISSGRLSPVATPTA